MSTATVRAGWARYTNSTSATTAAPLQALLLVFGSLLAVAVAPLWGAFYPLVGLQRARQKFEGDGALALGHVLAPTEARAAFSNGVWSGLWRVHGVALANSVVSVPGIALAFVPAAVVHTLMSVVATTYPPTAGLIVEFVPSAIVSAGTAGVVLAQRALVWRLAAGGDSRLSLGKLSEINATAWRISLRDAPSLFVSGALIAVMAALAAGFAGLNVRLALALDVGPAAMQIFPVWLGLPVAALALALWLEMPLRWAQASDLPPPRASEGYAFTDWLRAWVGDTYAWFAKRGMLAIGTAVCLAVGVLTGVTALITQSAFASWIGLGWFVATGAMLVTLYLGEKKR